MGLFWNKKKTDEPWPRTLLTLYLRYGDRVQITLNTTAIPAITADLTQAMRDGTPYMLKDAERIIFAVQVEDLLAFTALPDTLY
jgi:hypothetical protein